MNLYCGIKLNHPRKHPLVSAIINLSAKNHAGVLLNLQQTTDSRIMTATDNFFQTAMRMHMFDRNLTVT